MIKTLFASKSCSALGMKSTLQASSKQITPIIVSFSQNQRHWFSDMSRDEYLKFKEDFLQKYLTKQRQMQAALKTLLSIRQQRPDQQKDEFIPIMDCIKSQNIPESDIKVNCVRATHINDIQLMVAADKIAEGAIRKQEQRSTRVKQTATKKEDNGNYNKDFLPIYKDC